MIIFIGCLATNFPWLKKAKIFIMVKIAEFPHCANAIASSISFSDIDQTVMSTKLVPDEIWLKVFHYLPTHFIRKIIAIVCKRFLRLSRDCSLIKEIRITELDQDFAYGVLRSAKNVTTLSVNHHKDVEFLVSIALQYCKNLQNLELINCDLPDDCR